MLIYVASYPRSGNRMTRVIFESFFEIPTTTDKKSYNYNPYYKVDFDFITNWRSPIDNSILPLWWHKLKANLYPNNLSLWIARYDLKVPPYTKKRPYLLPGCFKVLTPKNRQYLASDKSVFVVKTHEYPYPEYFDGEYVIQPVRHPGLVFISYHKFAKNYSNIERTIEQVIKGEVYHNSWSKWHESWEQIIPSLEDRFLRLHYENVRFDKRRACEEIKALTKLDFNLDNKEISLEELRDREPKMFGFGKIDGWEEHYTSDEIRLLWDLHGVTMQKLGYEKPALF